MCIYVFSEKGTMGNGTFKMFQGRREISIIWETGHSMLWEKGHFILWETENSILWEQFFPLGNGPLRLRDSGHPLGNGKCSSEIREILWETGYGKLDMLSSGIRTTYPLGNIHWEQGIWELRYNLEGCCVEKLGMVY